MRKGVALSAVVALAAMLLTCAALEAAPTSPENPKDSGRTPFFLVASPDMPDPLFQQTVILMLPPTELPIVAGIVINKPTKMTLGELFSHSAAVANQTEAVYYGGPVELTSPVILMRAGRAASAKETHLFEDVYMSEDAGLMREMLKRPESGKDVRLFLGRAQWTVDQLHGEILRGAWTVSPAKPDLVFSRDPASVWRLLAQQAKMREVEWNKVGALKP